MNVFTDGQQGGLFSSLQNGLMGGFGGIFGNRNQQQQSIPGQTTPGVTTFAPLAQLGGVNGGLDPINAYQSQLQDTLKAQNSPLSMDYFTQAAQANPDQWSSYLAGDNSASGLPFMVKTPTTNDDGTPGDPINTPTSISSFTQASTDNYNKLQILLGRAPTSAEVYAATQEGLGPTYMANQSNNTDFLTPYNKLFV